MNADPFGYLLVKVPFALLLAAIGLWVAFGLARGLYIGRYPRRSSLFRPLADSDLDYAYRDSDFLGFWGAFNVHVLFLFMVGYSMYVLLD